MKIVNVDNIEGNGSYDVAIRKAFDNFLKVEQLCMSIGNHDEGLGMFAHVWVYEDKNMTFIEQFQTFSQIGDWMKHLGGVRDPVLYIANAGKYGYYGFFGVSVSDVIVRINKEAINAINEDLTNSTKDLTKEK